METRNLKVNIETARDWYNGDDKTLKELALQAFSVNELTKNVQLIKTFKDACNALKFDYGMLKIHVDTIAKYSKASAAMFKLNIIRKALNLGRDLHLTKNPKNSYVHYPYNPFITKNSTLYESQINTGKIEVIGKIKSEGEEYNVLHGCVFSGIDDGVGGFSSCHGVGYSYANLGFFGCATREIAEHFGRYFGMLITEAKYGDMVDFKIISSKYPN